MVERFGVGRASGRVHRDHVLPRLAAVGAGCASKCAIRITTRRPRRRYRQLARELGLLVTGGSDFHGDTGHRTAILGSVTLPAADYEAFAGARPRS